MILSQRKKPRVKINHYKILIMRKKLFFCSILAFSSILLMIFCQGFFRSSNFITNEHLIGNPKTSNSWILTYTIEIDDLGLNNWKSFEGKPWLSGNGTSENPYVIENITFNIEGIYFQSCIKIENSNKYFIVRNCIASHPYIYHQYYLQYEEAGITLYSTSNAQIIDNDLSNNIISGIILDNNCINNTISGNTINNNLNGITLYSSCDNNTISGNNINDCEIGIKLNDCIGLTLFDNNIHGGGLNISGSMSSFRTHDINTSNEVNGKPLYYYVDETGLNASDFLNAGQVIMINCSHSTISGLNISNTQTAIYLHSSSQNIISGNVVSENGQYGLFLEHSVNNILFSNMISDRLYGIALYGSYNNIISNNTVNYNGCHGLWLQSCENNILCENNVSNYEIGIKLDSCIEITLINNTIHGGGLNISGSMSSFRTHDINTSNEVNGKPLYYYVDETGLNASDFLNAGQVIMINCSHSTISGLNISNTQTAIYLHSSSYNNISGNIANDNDFGILLNQDCHFNKISENMASDNVYGMYLFDLCNNNCISNNTINDNNYYGLCLEICNSNSILGNIANYNDIGICLILDCNDNNISENTANHNGEGIFLFNNSERNIISENIVCDNDFGIFLFEWCNNNTISDNMINDNNFHGLYLEYCNNCIILENTVSDNNYGIFLYNSCFNNTILGNSISENGQYGIYLNYECNSNTISRNSVSNNGQIGIYLHYECNNNIISKNTINYNANGIVIYSWYNDYNQFGSCANNTLWGNNISNCEFGIIFDNCIETTLFNNSINGGGLYIIGSMSSFRTHDINTSNEVNGKPLYYYVDETGLSPSDFMNAGQVFMINCNHSTVSGLNISNTYAAIYLYSSSYNTILGNTINNNDDFGLCLDYSDYNTISNNSINGNINGISLYDSCNNTILNNTINDNGNNGLNLEYSDYNIILENTIKDNGNNGLYLVSSDDNIFSENTIRHNNCGTYLISSSANTISKNTINDISFGIFLSYGSNYNNILDNIVNNTGHYAIATGYCNNNSIIGNSIEKNEYGIYIIYSINSLISENTIINSDNSGLRLIGNSMTHSHNNTISKNTISDCDYGVYLNSLSDYNEIFKNNLINNTENARDDGENNQWDDGLIGNYWDDYTGVDEEKPYGIGDSPYNISGAAGAQDHYPVFSKILNIDFTTNATYILESEWVQFNYNIAPGDNEEWIFTWNFGDGGTSTERNPVHQYTTVGLFTVNLTVTDECGNIESVIKYNLIIVEIESQPSVDFTANITTTHRLEWIQFNYTGIGGNGQLTFSWDFGDGGTSTEQNPIHQYTIGGIYTVSLTVIDNDKDEDIEIKYNFIYVEEYPIIIDDSASNNWKSFEGEPWLSGDGSLENPYIIENVIINGNDSQACINIRNSNVHFIIRNCTLYNSENGIKLYKTSNGMITKNNCSFNEKGITLTDYCSNNIISENSIKNNSQGLYFYLACYNNVISENIMKDNAYGMALFNTNENNISGNSLYNNSCGIYISGDNNVISGNIINDNNDYGIYLGGCYENIISRNTINDNDDYGIYFSYSDNNIVSENMINTNGYGMYLLVSDENTILGNYIINTIYGIYLDDHCENNLISKNMVCESIAGIFLIESCDDNVITENTVFDNFYGIYLRFECINNTILGNIVNSNNVFGIYLFMRCDYNVISENTINHNSEGILLEESNDNNIVGNLVNDNLGSGILIKNSNNNNIVGNLVNDNLGSGIYLYSSDYNSIFKNTLVANILGMQIYSSNYDIISENIITNSMDYGINVLGTENIIYKNTFRNNYINAQDSGTNNQWDNGELGNYWDDYLGIDVVEPFGIGDTPYDIYGNTGAQDRYPLIFPPDSWFLLDPIEIDNQDVNNWAWATTQEWCSGNGTLSNPYILENLVIDGDNIGYCISISNSEEYFIIKNCRLYNSIKGLFSTFDAGIKLYNVENGQILDTICSYNKGAGLSIVNSDNNFFAGNTITNNRNNGILLQNSHNNIFSGNTVNYNTGHGFYLQDSANNVVFGNAANENSKYGIHVIECENYTFSGNTANFNTGYGIYLKNCDNCNLTENTANNNDNGIYLLTCYECKLSNNTANNNNNHGIFLQNSDNNYLTENTANNNAKYGFYVYYSNYNNFQDNVITNNNYGIYVTDFVAIVSYNGNYYIIIYYSQYNNFYGNIIEDNNVRGIFIKGKNNVIYFNVFIDNNVNAEDKGKYNQWDNGSIGNFWSDYTGVDVIEPYGIGDTPYNIYGSAGAQDRYPLMTVFLNADFIASSIMTIEIERITFMDTGNNSEYVIFNEALSDNGISSLGYYLFLIFGMIGIISIISFFFGKKRK